MPYWNTKKKFDKVALTALAVTEAEQAEAEALVGEELKKSHSSGQTEYRDVSCGTTLGK